MIEINDIYGKMYQYMIDKDTRALEKLLDDSFVLIHMTGMRQSKQDFITAIANGTLNYYSCDDTMLEISENGNTAHINGKSKVTASVFGGSCHTWPLQLDLDIKKVDNNWKIIKIKATTY